MSVEAVVKNVLIECLQWTNVKLAGRVFCERAVVE